MSRINYIYSKICSHEDALRKIEAWKLMGQKVGYDLEDLDYKVVNS